MRAAADIVTITSYNEWHEGTQIEPAQAVGAPYASYDGAYGLTRPGGRAGLPRPHGRLGAAATASDALGASDPSLVESGGEAPAVGADERVVGAEPLERATATSRRRSRSSGAAAGTALDDEPKRAFDVAGVERGDDVRQLAGRAELLEQGIGARWGEQLVEETSTASVTERRRTRPRPCRPGTPSRRGCR